MVLACWNFLLIFFAKSNVHYAKGFFYKNICYTTTVSIFYLFYIQSVSVTYFAFYKWDNVVCNNINAMNDILMSKEMDYSSMHRSICLKKYHCRGQPTINTRCIGIYNYSLIFIYFLNEDIFWNYYIHTVYIYVSRL